MKGGKIPLALPVRGTGQKHDRKRLIKDGISGKKRANDLQGKRMNDNSLFSNNICLSEIIILALFKNSLE